MTAELKLQHVALWENGREVRLTPEIFKKRYPLAERNSPRLKANLFCQLCRERVTFCDETTVYYSHGGFSSPRRAHFKHCDSKHDVYCAERSARSSSVCGGGSTGEREFPLRLALNRSLSLATFELGIPRPPSELLVKARRGRLKLLNAETGKEARVYDFASLFARNGMNYVAVGGISVDGSTADQPASRYRLKLERCASDASKALLKYWGISELNPFLPGVSERAQDVWFDAKTGRKLPFDAAVYVGCEYYLLTRRNVDEVEAEAGDAALEIERVGRFAFAGWVALYKITPRTMDDAAKYFFWRRGGRLTSKAAKLIEVWPPSATDGGVIRTCNYYDYAFFYFAGESQIKEEIYPKNNFRQRSPIDQSETRGFFRIGNEADWGKIALVSEGNSNALHYAMIWRDRLNFTATPPTVEIVDEDDWATRFDGEVAKTLPKLREVRVKFRFDGVLEIWRNGALTERRELKAKKASDDVASTVVKDVGWGTTLKIWLGRDCVRTLRFERVADAASNDALSDRDLSRKLRLRRGGATVGFSRSNAAALASRLNGAYPATKTWLRQAAQVGEISQDALAILKDVGRR